ncbi:hypothetical protein ES703_102836 [subsurface metagenome]
MGVMIVLAAVGSVMGLATVATPLVRAAQHGMNRWWPNEVLDPGSAVAIRRRQLAEAFDYPGELKAQGFDEGRQELIYKLSQQLLGLSELITLYRRGQLVSIGALYDEADKVGWAKEDVDYMLKVTEVIPTAGDIIRYAVREVYSPEISEPFGQFDGLPEVLDKAKDDITAAGLPELTFTKEWAAHWLLPSIMQGFEMLHRGVIPAISTTDKPLGLDRLMKALDIMPAWQKPLTDISYSPYTRVDVRRMHKTGVLDDEAVFTAYADVGFSPFAPGCMHDSVAEAFACTTCRHESKAGHMLDFTIMYNTEPPQTDATAEDTERHKQKDLTKADILNGYRDGLLDEDEVKEAIHRLGYSLGEAEYYLAREDYQKDMDELSEALHYLHDAYIKGVIDFAKVTDEMGKLNLPAKMTEHYQEVWDLEKIARSNKPTKSELMAFLRKEIIDEETWHTEMVGLGYPDRYIKWYAATL